MKTESPLISDYYASILASIEDLRRAGCPLHIWRELDEHVGAVRDFVIEYRVIEKGKTLCEVFAGERRKEDLPGNK